jgi:sigma-B regulation protein RsbU (phosphoserine phosphatase)
LFSDSEYFSRKEKLEIGDSLVLYSDGLSETLNIEGEQYGDERLSVALRQRSELQPKELLAALLEDLKNYHTGVPATDDLTIMVIRRDL